MVYFEEFRNGKWLYVIGIVGCLGAFGVMAKDHPLRMSYRQYSVAAGQAGHYWMKARLNGVTTERFILDSGSFANILTKAAAKHAGLTHLVFDKRTGTVGSDVATASATLSELRLGPPDAPIILHNVPVYVVDSNLDVSLLGVPFIEHFPQISITSGTMTIFY